VAGWERGVKKLMLFWEAVLLSWVCHCFGFWLVFVCLGGSWVSGVLGNVAMMLADMLAKCGVSGGGGKWEG